jgi:chemotaxis protein MotA
MDLSSVLGLIIGVGALLAGFLIEGGSLGMINPLHHPSPFIIIYGGTTGCVVLSFPMAELVRIPATVKFIFKNKKVDIVELINKISNLADKARKDGLLSLEQEAQSDDNPFIKKGLSLIVDGVEPETVRDILARESFFIENLHESSAKLFEAAGGFCPTMGVSGTVLGMIVILADMSDPGSLGGKISVAFIATLLGVGTANLAFLPMAGKIKNKAAHESMINDIVIEGLLSIQAGEHPRIIKEKLNLSLIEKLEGKKSSDTKEGGEDN